MMILDKIFKTNKVSSNMTKKHIFAKISTRLIIKNIDKNLSVEMKYKYFSYKKNVIFVEIRIANEIIVVKKNDLKKKKNIAFVETIITQLNREIDVRENIQNNFDKRLNVLMKKYRYEKKHCNNYEKHCYSHSNLNRHIFINVVEFISWQHVIDIKNDIIDDEHSSRTIINSLKKRDFEKHKNKKKSLLKKKKRWKHRRIWSKL